jgi:8-oxo-dGTP pyrophosphatase MutT (NUDIX family)
MEPRKDKNGFAIILKNFPKNNKWYALIQYRSPNMKRMPGFLGCPGGMCEKHENSLQTVARETSEETGLVFENRLFYKFNEGKNCDWFAIIKSEKPKNHEYVDVKTKEEVQDVKILIKKHKNWKCIRSMIPGHFWIPVNCVDKLTEHKNTDKKTMVMGGLISRIKQSIDVLYLD